MIVIVARPRSYRKGKVPKSKHHKPKMSASAWRRRSNINKYKAYLEAKRERKIEMKQRMVKLKRLLSTVRLPSKAERRAKNPFLRRSKEGDKRT
tara:strand:- start:245 stop:526 length:282 start_codon:yes stop_codon:yes gene_type:complete